MVIVRLWGGLGNQMFQYACGYALAKRHNEKLILDTRFYNEDFLKKNPHFSKQQLNIVEFPIKYNQKIDNNDFRTINFFQKRIISRIIRIPSKFNIKVGKQTKYIKETRLRFLPYIENIEAYNIYLDGYWQTEKYFIKYKKEIKEQFSLESVVAQEYGIENELKNVNSVSIHLRMGDYETKKKKSVRYNYLVNPEYYVNAIEEIRKRIHNPRFFIFSNDMKKAKKLLGCSPEFVYVNEDRRMTDLEEFEIMSLCSNHIISNSTFSWWAAWLSDNEDAINIAPDMFFGNLDIIPTEWMKVKVTK